MIENDGFKMDPRTYETWVGFAHDFCKGCAYESGSDQKRFNKCHACMDEALDRHFYKIRQPIFVARDDEGRNVASLEKEKQ